jgi:hypothetical protein
MQITSGKFERGKLIIIYGAPGIGKTTLAGTATNPVFIDFEHGSDQLDVSRIHINSFDDYENAMRLVYKEQFKTIVIDSVTSFERKLTEQICFERKIKTLARAGFGQGFQDLKEMWHKVLRPIEAMLAIQKNVILIGHQKIRIVQDPVLNEGYDRVEIDVSKDTLQTLVSASDIITLMRQEFVVTDNEGRSRAIGSGKRILLTQDRPGYLAKSRYQSKEKINVSAKVWNELLNIEEKIDAT